uniref:B box-type domain-containing protein n=1 Tax=Sphaeramia orbicularis TaxID=375764 RepID=A0A672YS15_9TELE
MFCIPEYFQCWSIDMAAAGHFRSEDRFLCSICLDVFTDPVTTSCGHNFCKSCICEHWRSCLVCLTSYCQTHLEPHLTLSGLKRHQLIHPVENLEDRICRKHDKPLELFCKTDHTCICLLCPVLDHKNHEFVPLKDQCEEEKAEVKQMIQERRLKIQQIQRSVKLSKNAADRNTAEGVEVYTGLMESVQRSLDQLKEEIQEKQRSTEKQAEDFIEELEQEICELEKRSTEMEQFSGSEDHLHFEQTHQMYRFSQICWSH